MYMEPLEDWLHYGKRASMKVGAPKAEVEWIKEHNLRNKSIKNENVKY